MRPMRIASTNIIAPRSTAATQITDRLLVTSANAPNTSMPIGAEAFPTKNITESTRPLIDSGVRVAIAVRSGMLANIRAIPQTSIPPYKRYGDASRQPPIIASDAASMKRLETIRCSRRNFGVQTDCNSEAVRIPMLQKVSAIARLFTPRCQSSLINAGRSGPMGAATKFKNGIASRKAAKTASSRRYIHVAFRSSNTVRRDSPAIGSMACMGVWRLTRHALMTATDTAAKSIKTKRSRRSTLMSAADIGTATSPATETTVCQRAKSRPRVSSSLMSASAAIKAVDCI